MIDTAKLSDLEVVALTAYGECRGGGEKGMTSVINTIFNRAAKPGWWGDTPRDVCLKPEQYSCWIPEGDNYRDMETATRDDMSYVLALDLAAKAYAGLLPDITNGANSYYALSSSDKPYWSLGKQPCAVICNQAFYQLA